MFKDLEFSHYIEAEAKYYDLLNEYQEKRDVIISGCYPQSEVDPISFDIKRYHYRTEDAGLELIDLSNQYEKRLKRLKRDAERFANALQTLTFDERQAFNHMTYGRPTELDYWRNRDLNRNARDKIIDYLTDMKDQDMKRLEEEHQLKLKLMTKGND